MPELDVMEHGPGAVAGAFVGIGAFAPLLFALLPVLRRCRDANMTTGFIGVIVSFVILFASVGITYLFARSMVLPFSVGLLIGFIFCAVAVGIAVIMMDDHA